MTDEAGLEISAGLTLAVGSVQDEVRKLRRDLQAAAQAMPIDLALTGAATCPSGGDNFAISLGGPSQGRKWLIRQLVIGGGAFPFTAAGTGYIFCSSQNPVGPGGIISGSLDDVALASFPTVSFYSNRQMVVWPGEQVWVLITGGTAGVNYFVNGECEDIADRPTRFVDVD